MANPLGAVQVNDFGNPKVISAYAREVISGGQFVTGSTAAGVVSSGTSSFDTSDVKVYVNGSGAAFTGIALNNAASGALVTVAVEGVFLLEARGTVLGGNLLGTAGGDSVTLAAAFDHIAGRAITGATSGLYLVAHLRA